MKKRPLETCHIHHVETDLDGSCPECEASHASACSAVEDLCEAAAAVNRWLRWWLNNDECECEESHTCGKSERASEWLRLDDALQQVRQNDKAHRQRKGDADDK